MHDIARQARQTRAFGLLTAAVSAGACVAVLAGPWPWLALPTWARAVAMVLMLSGPLVLAVVARRLVRQHDALAAQAQQRRLQRRRALLALLDSLPLAVALCNPREGRAVPNLALSEWLQIGASGAQGGSFEWQQLMDVGDAADWQATCQSALDSGRVQWLRCSLTLGRERRPALLQAAPFAGEDGPELAVHLALADSDGGPAQEALLQLRELVALAESEKWQFGQAVHDELGQRLSGMAYFAKALQRKLQQAGSADADDALWLTSLANESMAVARALARGLLPVGTDDPQELRTALAELCERSARNFGIDCTVVVDPAFDAGGAAQASHLYRAIQELVTNAVKHGAARTVQVQLAVVDGGLRVTVRNDGQALAVAPLRLGMGLRGVRSRAAYLGAQFSLVDEAPGAVLGTIELPRAPE